MAPSPACRAARPAGEVGVGERDTHAGRRPWFCCADRRVALTVRGGTAMGFGSKLGKWFWDKGKDLFADDGH
ncbi:hypothetical protein [Streptomyces cupreus]|uniref:Uncharacterized protein n=1 Tax=Streptomyces cupreus TaxID=2759956 RepID=A0A7X1J646_9ACTN|nr:hypothetical protein [Streptomyces cupreus]MBC2904816.1 hypothetical protein [Streptomyces cupreus]